MSVALEMFPSLLGILKHDIYDIFTVIDEAEITLAIQSDAKSLDRLAERAYSRDWARLGIGSLLNNQQRSGRYEAFQTIHGQHQLQLM